MLRVLKQVDYNEMVEAGVTITRVQVVPPVVPSDVEYVYVEHKTVRGRLVPFRIVRKDEGVKRVERKHERRASVRDGQLRNLRIELTYLCDALNRITPHKRDEGVMDAAKSSIRRAISMASGIK